MINLSKKQMLKIACAAEDISVAEFARRCGVSHVAIVNTLNGATSKRLNQKIDTFIATQFKKLRLSSGSLAA